MQRPLVRRQRLRWRLVLSRDGDLLAAYITLDIDPAGHTRQSNPPVL